MLSCLKNKFKYNRKTDDEPTPLMLALRKKYGRKGKAQPEREHRLADAETDDEGDGPTVADPTNDPAGANNVKTAAPRKTVERDHVSGDANSIEYFY